MNDTTWIPLAEGVNAEVQFDSFDYNQRNRVIEGRLTGRVQMHRDAIEKGMWGLPLPGDNEITKEP